MASINTLLLNISNDNIFSFFQSKIGSFTKDEQTFLDANIDPEAFDIPEKIGEAQLNGHETLLVFSCRSKKELNKRSAKKKQFEIAKRVLKEDFRDGAIFIFYDAAGKFRFSFIRQNYGEVGDKKFTSWKRYTYLVDPTDKTNKTFINRIGNGNFESLNKIQKAFSVAELTKEFYNELFAWYQWTLSEEIGITFPNNTAITEDDRIQLEEHLIRLITRILFVWFIKQKHLAPETLFEKEKLVGLLKDFDPESATNGNYYNAILQNLFFATLNKTVTEREFARLSDKRDIKTRYRYADMFAISEEEILDLFHQIPFLNGGLFECLDKEQSTDGVKYHLDGFSRNGERFKNGHFKHRAFIPNCVFFDEEKGLFPLLNSYNFTVEENAPNEVQVALDPELLGKVFENLLGAFNPETQQSARNESGSFYTPRDIVEYMVKESLCEYLKTDLPQTGESLIRDLLTEEALPKELEKDKQLRTRFSAALRKIKILDPACGSGAFPMGALKKMVEVLEKLDQQDHYDLKLHLIEECIYGIDIQPIATQISRLRFFIALIVEQDDIDFSKPEENYGIHTLPNLETKFVAANTLLALTQKEGGLLDLEDERIKQYKAKLLEIRHSHFYAQSASAKKKLRQRDEEIRKEIETYLTAHATHPDAVIIREAEEKIKALQERRKQVEKEDWVDDTVRVRQANLFGEDDQARSLFRKDLNEKPRKDIDAQIKHYRNQIEKEKQKGESAGLEKEIAELTQWNPYDQNETAKFFDKQWMFGLDEGFDVVIGNPPYIRIQGIRKTNSKLADELKKTFCSATGSFDLYALFAEKGLELTKKDGILNFIMPTKWVNAAFGKGLRKVIQDQKAAYKIISFEAYQVFNASTYTGLQWFKRNSDSLFYFQLDRDLPNNTDLGNFLNQLDDSQFNQYPADDLNENAWTLTDKSTGKILQKIRSQPVKVKDVFEKFFTGLQTSKDSVYFIMDAINDGKTITGYSKELDRQVSLEVDLVKPLLKGNQVHRYEKLHTDNYVIFPYKLEKEKALLYTETEIKNLFPKGYAYLKENERVLRNREKERLKRDDFWFRYIYPKNLTLFDKPKLICPDICLGGNYAYDIKGEFYDTTTLYGYIKYGKFDTSYKYFLGLLNSNLIWYFLKNTGTVLANDFFRFMPRYVNEIPIYLPIKKQEKEMISMVETILSKKEKGEDTAAEEREIDVLVYRLYELTYEEVLVVDPDFWLSREEYVEAKITSPSKAKINPSRVSNP